ncbi:MAG: TFIIB-type zinc ribbon-containing protein [Anaerolineae bacterium]|nr:TFIIB-type zinc ribbon-containing protein [Anaerolineae bacterium]
MSTPFPPPGFAPTTSALEGIEVYAPLPPEQRPAEQAEVVTFKCPNCGADRAYSAADGGLRCTFCGYHEVREIEIVGRQAEEYEFTLEAVQSAAHGWGMERLEIQCQNCGAATTLPPDELTTFCPFCHSAKLVQRQAPQDVLRPRFLIPLTVTPDGCHGFTREWLGSSWMTPRELKAEAVIRNFTPLYLPYWTFDAITNASWKAEVGRTKTVGSGKNRRTTTVWRWESGHVNLQHDDVFISGTTKISEILLQRATNYRADGLVPYEASFLAGIKAHAYERDLNTAWELGRSTIRERTKQACMSQASTRKIRNFSMQVDFADEKWRYVLVPVYISAYTYEDQRYQVLVNGQTGTVAGQRPVAWPKVSAVMALTFIPGLLVLCLALFAGAVVSGDAFEAAGVFALMLLGAAFTFTVNTVNKALSFDDA